MANGAEREVAIAAYVALRPLVPAGPRHEIAARS
jgi:hypothetical protein